MEDTTDQEREARRAAADPHAETAERLDREAEASGEQSFMSIGGVDVRELRLAHQEHPTLDRWHHTSVDLIGDIYGLLGKANARAAALEAALKAAEARIAELDPPKDDERPEPESPSAEVP